MSNEQKAHDIAIALATLDTDHPVSSDQDLETFMQKYDDYFLKVSKLIEKR